jgi:phenylacetate-CoA ligase
MSMTAGPIDEAARTDLARTDRLPRECLTPEALTAYQLGRLHALLAAIDGGNAFYAAKLGAAGVGASDVRSLADLSQVPFTTKAELVLDQQTHDPWGTVLSEPLDRYTRYFQTSSTTGRPLRWLDTAESWQWVLDCWKAVYRAARVQAGDRIFFPFSFGPFLGFWSAFEAGAQIGAQVVPGGGMSSQVRLDMIEGVGATVLCATPTYALRLAEVALEARSASWLAGLGVRVIIVAGEPGGSIPATRDLIARRWDARVIDHHGLTEVGPVSFECWERPGGLHLNEAEFIGEIVDPASGAPVPDGTLGELVITNLGRTASPLLRYRTGDLVVRRRGTCACGRTLAWLEGGILARVDDMVTVRGVNVYPAAIEAVVRKVSGVAEFRSTVAREGAMRTLAIEIELEPAAPDAGAVPQRVAGDLRQALGLTVSVQVVAAGSLPRYELKSKRFIVAE